MVSLADVYAEHNQDDLQIAPWDNHPNALAHRLVADLLMKRLASTPLGPEMGLVEAAGPTPGEATASANGQE